MVFLRPEVTGSEAEGVGASESMNMCHATVCKIYPRGKSEPLKGFREA